MLLALHKPYGVLSQFTPDHAGQRTLAAFDLPPRVYPVGRLDRDSEGLLLLTDDNRVKTRLLDPVQRVEKVYCVQVEGQPSADALARLAGGVDIRVNKRAHRTRPARVRAVEDPGFAARQPPVRFRKTVPTAWLELIITEGKNRQVRRMCAAVGLPVLRLVRVRVGAYELGELAVGAWRREDAPTPPRTSPPSRRG